MTAVFGTIDNMAPALNFHMARQNLIASNIANAATPRYVPREMTRTSGLSSEADGGSLRVTNPSHLGVIRGEDDTRYELIEEMESVAGNDLNRVSMEREMSRLSANTLKYQAVGKVISKQIGMLKYAAADAQRG